MDADRERGRELRTGAEIDQLLEGTRSVAVVGISPDSARPSHRVAAYLLGASDWTVYFVNPHIDTVLGRQVHPSLADLPAVPDIVDVFRRAEHLQTVTRQAIEVGADTVWFQLGLVDDVAAATAVDAGLMVVQNHCLRVEHARWRAYDRP